MFGVPIENLMFGGMGFLLAWLTALMVLPAVHNRAMRLARERYDDVPLSMQEIRAEKDTIRAGFAAATRDLELKIEKLREKTIAHTTDLAKKNQLVDRLKQEVDTVTAALRESETREQAARDALREARKGFADKDVTLGSAEGEISALKRDLAAKEAELRAVEKDLAALRSATSGKDSALQAAEKEIASVTASLREAAAREQAARDDLHDARRGFASKDASLGAFEIEIAALKRELASRDETIRTSERDLAAVRSELAGKDAALTRAEREIAAIKAEIAALTTLVVQSGASKESNRQPAAPRPVDVVPFVPAPRSFGQQQPAREPARPQLVQEDAALQPQHSEEERPAVRAPIDVVVPAERLIPPTIPQAPRHDDDAVRSAMTEIADAARRLDEGNTGPNQRLRAAYAPFIKNPT